MNILITLSIYRLKTWRKKKNLACIIRVGALVSVCWHIIQEKFQRGIANDYLDFIILLLNFRNDYIHMFGLNFDNTLYQVHNASRKRRFFHRENKRNSSKLQKNAIILYELEVELYTWLDVYSRFATKSSVYDYGHLVVLNVCGQWCLEHLAIVNQLITIG